MRYRLSTTWNDRGKDGRPDEEMHEKIAMTGERCVDLCTLMCTFYTFSSVSKFC